jgi:hypothetical protein
LPYRAPQGPRLCDQQGQPALQGASGLIDLNALASFRIMGKKQETVP